MRGHWPIGVEQAAQIVVEKDALRVERGPNTPEIVPAWIQRCQISGGLRVHLAPMWSPLIALENRFDVVEVRNTSLALGWLCYVQAQPHLPDKLPISGVSEAPN
jgi:hypothetical protein